MKWFFSYIEEVVTGYQGIFQIDYFTLIGYISLIADLTGHLQTKTFLIITIIQAHLCCNITLVYILFGYSNKHN